MVPPDILVKLLALRALGHEHQDGLSRRLLEGGAALLEDFASLPFSLTERHWHIARRQAVALSQLGIITLPVWAFPERLRKVSPLPPALFCRGNADLLRQPAWSIVGSRNASRPAMDWAAHKAAQAVQAGYGVVSGGARGIDAAAHRGALHAGGKTLAYLGVAIDRIYPQSNKPLFAKMIQSGGALASEYAPGETTPNFSHAHRNRFIAAHAECLYVAEAREKSGTLGTARYAHRFGVPVRIAPESVGGERAGLQQLIHSGIAKCDI